ncbi:type II toxin-antitoxin system RelE/ParE family toxin [Collinsella tanakaei]|uniref:Type II toxin-antitoxin system RelE/ParE family toxin n=1 Tax=Collinsella tanakaei TaxID=626935 RepID=A0A3E4QYY8_9ACTN|nr:type II toxin-antitoxin system RelE/ParE family toxin [Collinsella tanakaei]RGL12128.1 type II toxin-antitoxin system RelE/ParE family toxin [Collinsella tanakaei]
MKFRDAWLEAFWRDPVSGFSPRIPADVRKVLLRKLQMLDAACSTCDLRVPPSNHLEKLQGDRFGQYSIRVNRQWRLCFVWSDNEAQEVELCDYH